MRTDILGITGGSVSSAPIPQEQDQVFHRGHPVDGGGGDLTTMPTAHGAPVPFLNAWSGHQHPTTREEDANAGLHMMKHTTMNSKRSSATPSRASIIPTATLLQDALGVSTNTSSTTATGPLLEEHQQAQQRHELLLDQTNLEELACTMTQDTMNLFIELFCPPKPVALPPPPILVPSSFVPPRPRTLSLSLDDPQEQDQHNVRDMAHGDVEEEDVMTVFSW